MHLRVTRPAFIEGLRALKEQEGVRNYDVNTMTTRQEMRSFVCGQCHVEYYFRGPEKRLVFPWAKGLRVDDMLAYYEETQFKDWTHAETGSPVLKAQHPEFEMWNQGIHARSGVACADCHMPYKREGAMKISDHHVRSPLLNINRACQTCHKWPEAELKDRAEAIQHRTSSFAIAPWTSSSPSSTTLRRPGRAAAAMRRWPGRGRCSARRNSWWTSWRRRIQWGSMRRRKRRGSSARRSITPDRGNWRCAGS
ncbi:MAG: ammonia-forming cytochrome c nitrite reductase subunit c552 [Nitrospiraceae bacterium]|nr:ammonia-forming cytochrome c nitrite reductase subunit c552 [Nitrospira tepida]